MSKTYAFLRTQVWTSVLYRNQWLLAGTLTIQTKVAQTPFNSKYMNVHTIFKSCIISTAARLGLVTDILRLSLSNFSVFLNWPNLGFLSWLPCDWNCQFHTLSACLDSLKFRATLACVQPFHNIAMTASFISVEYSLTFSMSFRIVQEVNVSTGNTRKRTVNC